MTEHMIPSEATTAGAIRQSVEAIADVTQIRGLVRERNGLARQLAEAQAHNVQLRAAIEDLANRAERARRILQESGRRDGLRPDHCNWGMLDTSAARAALTEDTTNTSTQYVRSELAWFADRMERKLRTNDHKDHWRGMSVVQLLLGLFDEYLELQEAVNLGEPDKIIDEAIDCGAFAMMIADRVALEATPSNRTSTDGQKRKLCFCP